MKILETRDRKGIKWRRYRGEDGSRITTLEIPESVVKKLGSKAELLQLMREYQSTMEVLAWKSFQLRKQDEQSE